MSLALRQGLTVRRLACLLLLTGHCARADLWITGYLPSYKQSYMPASEVDFSVVTHLIHFSAVPKADGTLDLVANQMTAGRTADAVARAHAAGRKVLICAGGSNSETGFLGATSPANLSTFVGNLVNFMETNSYDGIDIDWEPLPAADFQQYTNLVIALRSALNALNSPRLLSAAAQAYPVYPDLTPALYVMYAGIQNLLDQINVMTYDLSGPYEGWVTWYNSPIYDGGARFPSNGRRLPSIDVPISSYLSNGVAATKVGVGTPLYGFVWSGASTSSTGGFTQPGQGWTNAPKTTAVAFYQIMSNYYKPELYHWDAAAQAAYLSVTNAVATNDQFISFDDEHSTGAKVSYARNLHLGGVMLWELSQDYEAGAAQGQRAPLLQAINQVLATPGQTVIQQSNQAIALQFTTAPLGVYRVLAITNLDNPVWVTLTNNVPGDSNTVAPVILTDPGAVGSRPQRFYRIQTPP